MNFEKVKRKFHSKVERTQESRVCLTGVPPEPAPSFDKTEVDGAGPVNLFVRRQTLFLLSYLHECAYTVIVNFEWDASKAVSNRRKHSIDFADAAAIFEDESALTIEEDHPNEERYVTIGTDSLMRVLVVVWTMRGENIRIIIST
jgi:uncharacterized DUF497 family protein